MITLEDIFQKLPIRVFEMSTYHWDCYGDKCYIWSLSKYVSLVFQEKTNRVFEVVIFNELASKIHNDKCFYLTWVDPEYLEAYHKECEVHNSNKYHVDCFFDYDEIIKKALEELND